MGDNHFPEDGAEVVEDAIATKVATMAVMGKNYKDMGKELGISAHRVKKILDTPECLRAIRSIENECLATAKARIKLGVARIATEVTRVIEKHLKENNLQAVGPALKILGFTEQDAPITDQKLVIVMPGADANKTIDISPKS